MTASPANLPGLLLAAPQSGAGKTTVCLGLLAALRRRGLTVQPFKCGPDFIDPSLHEMVTGRISRNLDLRMCGPDFVRQSFARHGRGTHLAVVEGVMGLFDGGAASSAALAKTLGLPVVLVVDARSMAESAAAIIRGFEGFDPDLVVAGVIVNRVGSDRHARLLRDAIASSCRAKLLGLLPRNAAFTIPERHLGLHMGTESPIGPAHLSTLTEAIDHAIDLDRLLALAQQARPAPWTRHPTPVPPLPRPRIAVARDAAFCFTYPDNLDLLEGLGAEIVFFSPLRDSTLPPDLDAVLLGGGYPELHAETLSANRAMLDALASWSRAGGLLHAECGGFMVLTEGIVCQGKLHKMVGVFPTRAEMRPSLSRLGYREIVTEPGSIFGPGMALRGHEFHYSDIAPMPPDVPRVFRMGDQREGYQVHQTLGSYIHLHFGQTPEAAQNFMTRCRAAARRRLDLDQETSP